VGFPLRSLCVLCSSAVKERSYEMLTACERPSR
jgi:hypothetical protein